MDIEKRLFRKPAVTVLWLLIIVLMTGFLTAGSTLYYSSDALAKGLDKRHTAIAVRTDPEVLMDGYVPIVERRFTSADVEALEALDPVKAVRSHTLTGGTSESFSPVTDISKDLMWRAPGNYKPYCNMVLSGAVTGTAIQENTLVIGVCLWEPLMVSDELQQLTDLLKYLRLFAVKMDITDCPEAAECFTVGERYVFSGPFDPREYSWDYLYRSVLPRAMNTIYVMDVGRVFMEDGVLCGVPSSLLPPDEMPVGDRYIHYSYPVAEELTVEPEAFFDQTEHGIWRDLRDALQRQNHALPVIGTDRLESMFVFVRGEAEIVDGRSFTEEEYSSGARVMIVSERIAKRGNLSVGDRVTMSQTLCAGNTGLSTNPSTAADRGGILRNPNVDLLDMNAEYSSPEEFEVVGIYRLQAEWSYGTYAVTPNTVFIPRLAQIEGAFGAIPDGEEPSFRTADVYGLYLSVELNNGSVEAFRLAVSGSAYAGQLYTFDQGFESVQRNLNALAVTSRWLFYIAAAGWVLLLMMFLLMYQAGQKRNLGVLLSLGAEPADAARYLAGSGGAVALAGVSIGAVINGIVLSAVQNRLLAQVLSGIDLSQGGVSAVTEEALSELIAQSSPGLLVHLLLAGCQLALILIFIVIQAVRLSKQNPRALMAS